MTLSFGNAVIALSATILLTLSFALGPVSHLVPSFTRARAQRKAFGLIGYALAALHSLLAGLVVLRSAEPVAYSDAVSVVFASLAFTIFTLMALTSTSAWIRALGYANWKALQRTGYLALAFTLLHVVLLEQGVFLTRVVGQTAIGFMLLVLLVRAVILIGQARPLQLARTWLEQDVDIELRRTGPTARLSED